MSDAVVSYTFFCSSCKTENRTLWTCGQSITYEQARQRILAEQWEYREGKGFRCSWCVLMEQYQKRLVELSLQEECAWLFEPLPLGRKAYKERPMKQVIEYPSILGKKLQKARKARGYTLYQRGTHNVGRYRARTATYQAR